MNYFAFTVLIALVLIQAIKAGLLRDPVALSESTQRQLEEEKKCTWVFDFGGGWCLAETCTRKFTRKKRITKTECRTSTGGGSVCGSVDAEGPPKLCGEIKYEVTTTTTSATEEEEHFFGGDCKTIDHMWPHPNDCYCYLDAATDQEIEDWQNEPLPPPTCAGGAGACPNTRCPTKAPTPSPTAAPSPPPVFNSDVPSLVPHSR